MRKKSGHGDMENPEAGMDSSGSIGAYLRAERLGRDVSLAEVSDATGISSAVLQALENEERDQLPAEVYIKAFYKKYAAYLGIDPAEIQTKYQQRVQGLRKPGGKSHFNTVITLKGQEEKGFNSILRKTFLTLAILVLGIIFYWIFKNYLLPGNPLGLYQEQYPALFSFVPADPSGFFS
jgi:cytoskeletal protein RodZ